MADLPNLKSPPQPAPPAMPPSQANSEIKPVFTTSKRALIKKLVFSLPLLLLFALVVFLVITFIREPSLPPEAIRISNLTESSLTISWVSNKSVRQKVHFSPKPSGPLSFFMAKIFPSKLPSATDDFGPLPSTVHHVTLKNLEPDTQYYYFISNGLHSYTQDRQKSPFPPVRTAAIPESVPAPYPCYGTVLDFADEMPLSPVIVYLSAENSSLISVFTNSAGNYSLDLANLKLKDLSSPFDFQRNTALLLETQGGLWGTKTQPLFIKNCQPVATILLE